MKRLRMTCIVGAFICSLPVLAAASLDGGTSSNLSLGAGSRGIALAGSFLADVQDASAVYWNPAALALLPRGNFCLMHAPIEFGDAAQTFVALGYPTLRGGSFGLGVMRLGTDGIQAFDAQSTPLGEIRYAETSVFFSYAHRPPLPGLGNRMSIGTTMKTLTQNIAPWSSTGVGLDVGVQFDILRHSRLATAVVCQDLVAPRIELDRTSDTLPRRLLLGGTYRLPIGQQAEVSVHGGASHQAAMGWKPRVGLELRYRHLLSLRVGGSTQGFAVGVGLRWDNYALDYTRLVLSQEATHPVNLGLDFGTSIPTQLAAIERTRQLEREAELRARLDAMVDEHSRLATQAFEAGDYVTALEEWKLVVGLEPANEHAQTGLARASALLAEENARSLKNQSEAASRAAQFEIGLRYYSENEYVLARNMWKKLLETDPTDATVKDYLVRTENRIRSQIRHHAAVARRLEQSHDYISALTEWNLVRDLDPKHADAGPGVARCREAIENAARTTQRLQQAERARQSQPAPPAAPSARERANAAYRDAVTLYSNGDVGAAANKLREVIEFDPQNQAAKELLAKAERQLRPLTPEEHAQVRQIYLRGMSHFMAGDYEASIAEWSKILSLDPGNESVYRNIDEARARLQESKSE